MKTVVVSCSPRIGGNSDQLAAWAQADTRSERLTVRAFPCAPCDGCGACEKSGSCKFDSDNATAFYRKLLGADRLIIVAPVYFSGFNAATKALIDRAQPYFYAPRPNKRKPLCLICVGGQETADNFEGMKITCKNWACTIGAQLKCVLNFIADGKGQVDTADNRETLKQFLADFIGCDSDAEN